MNIFLRKKNKDTSVLNTDEFDKRRFRQIYDMSKGLQELVKYKEFPFLKELLGDIWASLYKMNPKLKDDDEINYHLYTNKELMKKILNDPSYQKYHEITKLDDLLSAIGTLKFGKQMSKWLEDQRLDNNKMHYLLKKINDLMNQQNNSDEKEKTQGQKELEQALADLSKQMNESLTNERESFSQSLEFAVQETKEIKKNMESLFGGSRAGKHNGELQKMPLRDKINLAEILSNDPKIKDVAKWAGRYNEIARTKQKMKYKQSTEQSGVEVGNDLERLLPSELLQYANPKTKKEFLRRFLEKETLQYEQKGKQTLGQGSIILCLDQSGSMNTLETQSKGFALALMSIAKKQKRNFAYIPFSNRVGEVKEFSKGKIKAKEMIDLAINFLNGGTNFTKPLRKSLDIIKKDKFKDGDIIFVTDGEAPVSNSFLDDFLEIKAKERFHVLSLLIGSKETSVVKRFSDRVILISDFNDEGSFEAFEI